jgi:hypothetical protein
MDENETMETHKTVHPSPPDADISIRLSPSLEHPEQPPSRQPQQQHHRPAHLSTPYPVSFATAQNAPPSLQLRVPAIVVQPSTPAESPIQLLSRTDSPTRPASPNAMLLSPATSWSANASPVNSRRQRVTMGPRADCEKCKLGVKGHWMHFD